MKLEFSRQIFKKKFSNVKFRENPSWRSQAVPFGQTDVTKLTVGFHNFAHMPNNEKLGRKF